MNPRMLLARYDLRPRKKFGQNFLHDPNVLAHIADAAALTPQDTVLEIGPGTGALTHFLAARAGQVVAVELDTELQPVLAGELALYPHVSVVYQDILTVDVADLLDQQPYVVVANVPYYITSAIVRHLLEGEHRPRRMVLTVQLEVAERMVATPGDMSLLAVSVQFYGQPRIVQRLNPAVFWPRPEVDSAVIRIDVYDTPPVDVPDAQTFFRVVRAGFGQKRKQLRNSLAAGLAMKSQDSADLIIAAGIDPQRRAETLSLEEWASLARIFHQLRNQ